MSLLCNSKWSAHRNRSGYDGLFPSIREIIVRFFHVFQTANDLVSFKTDQSIPSHYSEGIAIVILRLGDVTEMLLLADGIGSYLCQISFSAYRAPGLTSRQYPPYGEQHKENTAAAKMVSTPTNATHWRISDTVP